MATQREVPKERGGWFSNSLTSLGIGSGRSTPAPASKPEQANSTPQPARPQEPAPRYLTTSGLFETPPRPPAWKEQDLLGPSPARPEETPQLVVQFRSALLQSQKEVVAPRKSRKGIFALAAVGVLLAATAGAIYLNHPKSSAVEFKTANTWVAKRWTAGIQEISSVFHSQTTARNTSEPNPRRLSRFLRGRQSAYLGAPRVPASLWETGPDENAAHFDLYITDTFGRRWILTPTGQGFGPTDHLGANLR